MEVREYLTEQVITAYRKDSALRS